MSYHRAALTILTGLMVALSLPVATQEPSTEPAPLSVLEYLDVALAHQPQRFDVPARTIAALPSEAGSRLIAYIPQLSTTLNRAFRKPDIPVEIDGDPSLPADIQKRLGLTDSEIAVGNYLPLLVRVLTLHADAGLGLAREGHYSGAAYQFALGLQAAEMLASPPPPRSVLETEVKRVGPLGHPELQAVLEAHRAVARSAILAFGGVLTPNLLGDAERMLERGLQLFGGDPELELALGAVHESLARPEPQREIENRRTQARLRGSPDTLPGSSVGRFMNEDEKRLTSMNRHAELSAAAHLFREALAGTSSRDEASLRLGHVMMEQGKVGDAVPLLEAASASRDTFVRYNGLLLLARVNADAGRPREAAQRYRLAATVFPGARAPVIGLSLLDDDAGQTDAALDGLRATLSNAAIPSPESDPWWVYYHGGDRFVPEHLDRLYAAARAAAVRRH